MISISHAPNTTHQQRRLALSYLMPWRWIQWKAGGQAQKLEQAFKDRFKAQEAVAFSTGREALYAVLKSFGIGYGDEVIVQAYTCIVVPHAVIWTGAAPVYVDIDETLNIDATKIEAAITPKTKAVIVQHTFGVPADVAKIKAICEKHKVLLIEDCAHALGALFQGREVGIWGDAAIFSFGRDKIISSVSGGMAITHMAEWSAPLRRIQAESPQRSRWWIAQNLLHPLFIPALTRTHFLHKAKSILIRACQALRLLNKVYSPAELSSQAPDQLTYRMPQAMAALALQQMEDHLAPFNHHRLALAHMYATWASDHGFAHQQAPNQSQPSWLRFTVFSPRAKQILPSARQAGWILGDWYSHVIMPRPEDMQTLHYQPKSCPIAEAKASQSLNLPTHHLMSKQDALRLLSWLETHL